MTDDGRLDMIHRLRALTVQLDLLGAEFAQKHALHPTDLRALIGLLDRERAGEIATPGWLAEHLRSTRHRSPHSSTGSNGPAT